MLTQNDIQGGVPNVKKMVANPDVLHEAIFVKKLCVPMYMYTHRRGIQI